MTALPPLPRPWVRPDPDACETLLAEARREIKPGHELDGVELVSCVARCSGCDLIVFWSSDEAFVVVHLTWAEDERPPLPKSTVTGFLGIEMVMDSHKH